jgi:hypothetical protein
MMGSSNAFRLQYKLPQERDELLATLDEIINNVSEEELQSYRANLRHL